MASAKGLNPFAAEFKSQTRFVFSNSPLPAPLNPYASSIYSFSSSSVAYSEYYPTCFPSSPTTYSPHFPTEFPYPALLKHDLFPATELSHQSELAEVQQPNHDSVTLEATTPKLLTSKDQRIHGSKRGYRRYGRSKGRSSRSTDQKQERRPALKSERKVPLKFVEYNWSRPRRVVKSSERKVPLKFVEYNWSRPRRVVKSFSDVLPVVKDGDGTTVMIRNIPNKFSRDLLMTFLDNHCAKENQKSEGEESESESAFDFLYLPIDFRTGMNKGYAFVNFTNPKAVWKFFLAGHCQTWELFHSKKIREIAYARIQGKKDLVEHFETMRFPCESENVLPVCFSPARNGSEKLVEIRLVGKLEGWGGMGLKGQGGTSKEVKEALCSEAIAS